MKTASNQLVSVVIVNYNGLKFLDDCFESLKARAFQKYRFEVIVVDNASSDGSLEYLRQRTDIRLIESPLNTGFTGGNNLGAQMAQGQILLLLNNDTRIESCLDPLIDALCAPGTGAAGCQLRYGDGRIQFSVGLEQTLGRILLSWLGLEKRPSFPSIFRKFETAPTFYISSHLNVAWVSGACLATWKSVWDQLGGLDEEYFMYCEDVDFCKRVRDSGLSITYEHSALVTHLEGGGKPWVGPKALLRNARSNYIYLRNHYNKRAAMCFCAAQSLIFLARALAFGGLSVLASKRGQRELHRMKSLGYLDGVHMLMKALLAGCSPPRQN